METACTLFWKVLGKSLMLKFQFCTLSSHLTTTNLNEIEFNDFKYNCVLPM